MVGRDEGGPPRGGGSVRIEPLEDDHLDAAAALPAARQAAAVVVEPLLPGAFADPGAAARVLAAAWAAGARGAGRPAR